MEDLKELTEQELEELAESIRQEELRRQRLATGLEQIITLTNQYVEAGGNRSDVLSALEEE